MPRYAGRRDENDPELAKIARRLGAFLLRDGPFDYWCGFRGVWRPVEIKRPERAGREHEYTPVQVDILGECHQRTLPVWVWRTPDDVYRDLNARG